MTGGNLARIAFNTTSRRDGARVVLKAGERVVLEERIDISPSKPYSRAVSLPPGTREADLVVSLLSSDGTELVAYRAKKTSPGAFPGHEYEGDLAAGRKSPMPEPVTPPAPPKDIASIEMLYLAGMRLEQFYNPAVDPMVYYEEALRRDPDDLRVNTAVGILMLRKGMFEEAEKHLRKAVKRATWNYTHPRDTEPLYYHGLALRSLGRHKEAYDALYEATWDDAFSSPGYYQLAEIAALGGRHAEALQHVDRALRTNALDLKALNLKAALLRKTGRAEESLKLASQTASADLLDFWSRNEVHLAQRATNRTGEAGETLASLRKLMRDEVSSYPRARRGLRQLRRLGRSAGCPRSADPVRERARELLSPALLLRRLRVAEEGRHSGRGPVLQARRGDASRQLLPLPAGDDRRAPRGDAARPRRRDGPALPRQPAVRPPAGGGHRGVGEGRRPRLEGRHRLPEPGSRLRADEA